MIQKESQRLWYIRNRERLLEYAKEYRTKNKDACYLSRKLWGSQNKEYLNAYNRKRNKEYKQRALAYINDEIKCSNCGFSDIRALQIDHKNGGGTKETKHFKNGLLFHTFILKMPKDKVRSKYQILCANCNWIKRVENHEEN